MFFQIYQNNTSSWFTSVGIPVFLVNDQFDELDCQKGEGDSGVRPNVRGVHHAEILRGRHHEVAGEKHAVIEGVDVEQTVEHDFGVQLHFRVYPC